MTFGQYLSNLWKAAKGAPVLKPELYNQDRPYIIRERLDVQTLEATEIMRCDMIPDGIDVTPTMQMRIARTMVRTLCDKGVISFRWDDRDPYYKILIGRLRVCRSDVEDSYE